MKVLALTYAVLFALSAKAQYGPDSFTTGGYGFNLYDFRRGNGVKIKYFAQNAYLRYLTWKSDKQVLLVCSGAFSETWEPSSRPVGFTVDNGIVVNRFLDQDMDGLVVVGRDFINAMDLDELESGIKLDDGTQGYLSPRVSAADRLRLQLWAMKESHTIFQTQLMYSSRNNSFPNLLHGKKANRRFLAICSKSGSVHNVIINAPADIYLNLAAKYALNVLTYAGFTTHFLLNLDTGQKDIFQARERGVMMKKGRTDLSKATNLIVFYQ